jgi:hypothetical protein
MPSGVVDLIPPQIVEVSLSLPAAENIQAPSFGIDAHLVPTSGCRVPAFRLNKNKLPVTLLQTKNYIRHSETAQECME